MTREHLYRPKGAGHSAPEGGKRDYVRPRDDLVGAFRKFQDVPRERGVFLEPYMAAEGLLAGIEGLTAEEVSSLPLVFEGADIIRLGIFMSAAYNLCSSDHIIFDVDTEEQFSLIGYKLAEDKVLTVMSDTYNLIGTLSRGLVINMGKANGQFGKESPGISLNYGHAFGAGTEATGAVVNYGTCEYLGTKNSGIMINFGEVEQAAHDISGIFINFGKVKRIGFEAFDGIVVAPENPGKLYIHAKSALSSERCREIPELNAYLNGLRERLGRERDAIEIAEELRGSNIKGDVADILRRSGWLRREYDTRTSL